jgi:hypothetical protein
MISQDFVEDGLTKALLFQKIKNLFILIGIKYLKIKHLYILYDIGVVNNRAENNM